MYKVSFVSLGCAKNQVDTEVMQGFLEEANYELTKDHHDSDIIIINTCGFIEDAKEESIDHILQVAELKNMGKLKALIVAGCLSQRYQQTLKDEIPQIDALIGTDTQDKITSVISSALEGRFVSHFERSSSDSSHKVRREAGDSHSVYVKIAEGCNNYCSYCAIPLIRGNYRSKAEETIVNEVKNFVDQGVKEINLIAQDTTNYGIDLYGEYKLPELLRKLADIDGDFWIRVLYGYPTRVSDELIDVIAKEEKICAYLDIPLQHVSNRILHRMNRSGDQNYIRDLVYNLRKRIPGLTLRTSFIVGFPGETEEEFEQLIAFIKEMELDHVGIFKYSQEEDTIAYDLDEQVENAVIEERYKIAVETQQDIARRKNEEVVGNVVKALIEEPMEGEPTTMVARGESQAPEVDGSIIIPDCENCKPGDFQYVDIVQALDYDLIGEMHYESS